jgi:signal transduction histidine kinase
MADHSRTRVVVVEADDDSRERIRDGLDEESERLSVEAADVVDDESAVDGANCVVTGPTPGGETPAAFANALSPEVPSLLLFAPEGDAASFRSALAAGYDGVVQDTGDAAALVALRTRVETAVSTPADTSVEAMLADTMATVNQSTRRLIDADSTEEVAVTMADIAAEVLDFPGTGVRLYNPENETLDHITFGDRIEDIERRPPYDVHDTPHGEAFRSGETLIEDIPDVDDPYEREVFSQTMYVPLSNYGVLSVGVTGGEFTDEEIQLTETVAETAIVSFEFAEQGERLLAVERELERQDDRLDQFATIISHDVRNPLQVALGRLGAIEEALPDEHATKFREALERMERIIEDMLVLTRKGQRIEQLQRVSLDSLCWSAWRSVDTAGATLEVHTEAMVLTDRERLNVAFEHLFRNSVEHASTGSRPGADDSVEHGSTGSEGRSPSGNRTQSDDSVEHGGEDITVSVDVTDDGFYVADDGVGLPTGDVDRLFEARATTERQGSGLGLAIVKEIADAHDWSVSATSSAEGGMRVEFSGVTVEDW